MLLCFGRPVGVCLDDPCCLLAAAPSLVTAGVVSSLEELTRMPGDTGRAVAYLWLAELLQHGAELQTPQVAAGPEEAAPAPGVLSWFPLPWGLRGGTNGSGDPGTSAAREAKKPPASQGCVRLVRCPLQAVRM